MSISIAYIPKGYSSEQKAIMIQKTKEACMKGLGLTVNHSFVFVQASASPFRGGGPPKGGSEGCIELCVTPQSRHTP